MSQNPPELICIDWGTTNLRAFALDRDGHIVDKFEAGFGIKNVANGDFGHVFSDLPRHWRDNTTQAVPVLMSGMIGSRQGWLETPYAPCPASPQDLATGLVQVPGEESTWIVPGICLLPDTGRPDVIRGEEVQVFGALDYLQRSEALLCLPGTHSKWVHAEKGVITAFATAMTGEVFQIMSEHSILGALMSDDSCHHPEAFEQGLSQAGQPGGLLNHLFTVRTNGLFDSLPATSLSSYLSGILIGHEIADLSKKAHQGEQEIVLLGSSTLAKRYGEAFDCIGQPFVSLDNDIATCRGLLSIARHAKLLN